MDVSAIGSATRTSAVCGVSAMLECTVHGQGIRLPRRASWAAGNWSMVASWGLVLRFLVRNDILQPDMILTASPTRSRALARRWLAV
jgi:hypothetical protein